MMRSDLFIEYVDTEWCFVRILLAIRAIVSRLRFWRTTLAMLRQSSLATLSIYILELGITTSYERRVSSSREKYGVAVRAYIISRIPYHFFLYSWFSAKDFVRLD